MGDRANPGIDPEYATSTYESMAGMEKENELNRFLDDL
jgi:hypothetical protein